MGSLIRHRVTLHLLQELFSLTCKETAILGSCLMLSFELFKYCLMTLSRVQAGGPTWNFENSFSIWLFRILVIHKIALMGDYNQFRALFCHNATYYSHHIRCTFFVLSFFHTTRQSQSTVPSLWGSFSEAFQD